MLANHAAGRTTEWPVPIFDIPHRLVKFVGAVPSFPAKTSVHAQLAPKELFGEEPLSGRLVVVPTGYQVQLKADMWNGGIVRPAGGRFARVEATGTFFDLALRVEGSIAVVEGEIASEGAFRRCIEMVAKDVPGFLARALHSPVRVTEVFGNVAEQFFEVEVRGEFENVVHAAGPETFATSIREEMDVFAKVPADGAERLFAACRYVNHARWLAYQGAYPAHFAAEQLLNLNKAIEVLLPHGDSIDKLREQLRELGLREEVVELVASLQHVRNKADVGHCAIELLDIQEHTSFHTFVLYANELVSWLVEHVATLAGEGRFNFRPLSSAKKKRDGTLAKVGELLPKVNPVRPETFLKS